MVGILLDIPVRPKFLNYQDETSHTNEIVLLFVLLQKRRLTTIVAILKSRRLLSDHSEILEECLSNDYDNSDNSSLDKYLDGISCSLLITSSIIAAKFLSKRYGGYIFDLKL